MATSDRRSAGLRLGLNAPTRDSDGSLTWSDMTDLSLQIDHAPSEAVKRLLNSLGKGRMRVHIVCPSCAVSSHWSRRSQC